MKKRVVCAAIAALLLAGPARALTEKQLLSVSEAVMDSGDPAASSAYLVLRQSKILEPDGKEGDLRQLVSFRVLEAGKPDVLAAFKLLDAKGVFSRGAATPAPSPAVGLSAADLAALERVKQAIADCRREQGALSSMFGNLTRLGWVRDRAELPQRISSSLDTMGGFYMQASEAFKPLAKREDPTVVAVGADLQRCQREMESWYDQYNRWASSN